MLILSRPSMVSPLNFDANTLTSKHGLASQLSYQYSQPYTLTAQLTPLNFMLILSPPSMVSPLNFHANTLNLTLSLLSSHL